MLMRHALAIAALGVLIGCGGGGGGGTPPSTVPPPPPTTLWTITGRITAYGSGAPVSGATVTPDGFTAVQTDANGGYKITGTTRPTSPSIKITVMGGGYLTRVFYARYQQGERGGVDVNVIQNVPPFSMDFYLALLRDSYETPGGPLQPNRRLMSSPKFYVRTVDQNGKAVEPEVLAVVLPAIRQAVRDWTNGVLSVSTLETGTETRQRTEGWVVVNITRDYQSTFCGQSYVGSTQGQIDLVDDRCNCGSTKISGATVAHEVGHAMGFFHVGDPDSLMFPYAPGNCPPGRLSANERYHSALAYARTRFNTDPDTDDESVQMFRGGGDAPDILIRN